MRTRLLILIFILLTAISAFSQIDELSFDGTHQFANSVATDGNWAVVGNMYQTGHLMGSDYPNAGMISIYKKSPNGNWEHCQDIDEPDYFAYENNPASPVGMYYGCDVDISDQHIIVGAYGYDSDMLGNIGPDGMAIIYKYNGVDEIWEKVAELAPEVAVINEFGWSVAISGYTAVVGDPSEEHPINGEAFDRDNIGAAYVYHYTNGNWELDTKLTASDGWGAEPGIGIGPGDNFGYAVDVDGNTVVVGAPNKGRENGVGQQHGAVYAYTKDAGVWMEELLDESAADNYSNFGAAVAVYNNIVVAGAPNSNTLANNAGKIATYENDFGIWSLANTQLASDGTEGDYFGFDVDIDNGVIIAGANNFDSKGKAYLYDYYDNMNETSIQALDIEIGDEYGFDVGISQENVAVGAWKTDRAQANNGTVYFYSLSDDVFEGNWTGAVSIDWYDTDNWSDNHIPNSLTDVFIPEDVPHYPTIDMVTALSRNLEIEAGATLTIGSGYLNVMGDVSNHGQIINDDILHFYVFGNTTFDGAGQQDIPAGEYEGEFHYNCGAESDMQGDVRINGRFFHDNNQRLNVGDYNLSLGDRISGTQRKIIFGASSGLHLFGERVADFFLPGNISQLNDFSIDIPGNEVVYINGFLTVNGQLSLLDGDVYMGFDTDVQLTIFNPLVIEEGRLLPHANGGNSSLVIMDNGKADDELYIPASLDELSSFWVSRSAPTLLLGDLQVNNLYALYTAAFDVNGFEVVLGPNADMWVGGDAQITQDMVGGDGTIDAINIVSGSPEFDFDVEVEGDLNIGAAAGQLGISPGRCITVNGTTTVGANLVLRSDATGSACFIDNGPVVYSSKADANIIVETYIPSKEEWHYVSSPVQNATAQFFAGAYLNAYNPDEMQWEPFTNLNQAVNTMQGYSTKLPANFSGQKLEFSGELNTALSAPLNIALSDGGDGYNLVGNPFPSTIDWDDANWTKTNLANAIYLWNAGTGSYTSYVNGAGVNGGTQYIAAMQGFFVEATGPNPSLQIDNNDVRKVNDANFLKSEREIENQLLIQLSNHNEVDEAMIRFVEGASPQFDNEFDARKLFGRNSLAQVYIQNFIEDELSIQTLKSVKDTDLVPLGIQIEESGEYELFFNLQNSFTEYVSITLEDKKNNDFISLQNHTSYVFQYDSEEEPQRFVLHFKDVTGVDELEELDVRIYYAQEQLYISNDSDDKFNSLQIYNMAGQLMGDYSLGQENLQSFDASEWSNGTYLVQLISNKKSVKRKIIINQ